MGILVPVLALPDGPVVTYPSVEGVYRGMCNIRLYSLNVTKTTTVFRYMELDIENQVDDAIFGEGSGGELWLWENNTGMGEPDLGIPINGFVGNKLSTSSAPYMILWGSSEWGSAFIKVRVYCNKTTGIVTRVKGEFQIGIWGDMPAYQHLTGQKIVSLKFYEWS